MWKLQLDRRRIALGYRRQQVRRHEVERFLCSVQTQCFFLSFPHGIHSPLKFCFWATEFRICCIFTCCQSSKRRLIHSFMVVILLSMKQHDLTSAFDFGTLARDAWCSTTRLLPEEIWKCVHLQLMALFSFMKQHMLASFSFDLRSYTNIISRCSVCRICPSLKYEDGRGPWAVCTRRNRSSGNRCVFQSWPRPS